VVVGHGGVQAAQRGAQARLGGRQLAAARRRLGRQHARAVAQRRALRAQPPHVLLRQLLRRHGARHAVQLGAQAAHLGVRLVRRARLCVGLAAQLLAVRLELRELPRERRHVLGRVGAPRAQGRQHGLRAWGGGGVRG